LTISADLILDVTGRGTVTPKWLEALGFSRPPEDVVQVGVGYTSRIYRRQPGDLVGAELIFITANPPHDQRLGAMFPLEDDRWIVTLAGWAGDHAPADEAGFLEFARSLPVQDIAERIPKFEPLSDIFTYNLPSNLRRRYDRLTRFPEGYLVLGDALCSFNPVYGQGMTSAALQAAALDEMLRGRRSLEGFWKPYFKRVAKIVNDPWSLAVSEDFLFPATKGKKPFGFGPINAYMAKVQLATHHDTVVYKAFLQVMNLASSPGSLFHPRILWRALRPRKVS